MKKFFKILFLFTFLIYGLCCTLQPVFCTEQINYEKEYESVKDQVLYDPNFDPKFKVILIKKYSDEFDKYITELKSKSPDSYKPYYYSGVWYSSMGKYYTGIENYNKAIELAPDNVYIYEYRAVAYNSIGKYDKMAEDIQKAISLAPNTRVPYELKLTAELQQQKYKSALNTIKIIKKLPASKEDTFSNATLKLLEKQIKRIIKANKDWQ